MALTADDILKAFGDLPSTIASNPGADPVDLIWQGLAGGPAQGGQARGGFDEFLKTQGGAGSGRPGNGRVGMYEQLVEGGMNPAEAGDAVVSVGSKVATKMNALSNDEKTRKMAEALLRQYPELVHMPLEKLRQMDPGMFKGIQLVIQGEGLDVGKVNAALERSKVQQEQADLAQAGMMDPVQEAQARARAQRPMMGPGPPGIPFGAPPEDPVLMDPIQEAQARAQAGLPAPNLVGAPQGFFYDPAAPPKMNVRPGVSEIAPVIPRTGYDSLAAIEEAYQNDEIEPWEAEAAVYESIMKDVLRRPFQSDEEWQGIVDSHLLEAQSTVRQWEAAGEAAANAFVQGEVVVRDQVLMDPEEEAQSRIGELGEEEGGRGTELEEVVEAAEDTYVSPLTTPEAVAWGALGGEGKTAEEIAAFSTKIGRDIPLYWDTPKNQYDIVTRQSLGTLAYRPGVAESIARNYSSVLGRYVLQGLMEIDETALAWELFPDFISRGFKQGAEEFFDQDKMDANWERLVGYSGSLGTYEEDAAELVGRDVIGMSVANIPTYQVAAAMARGGITGRGIYGQLAEKAFTRYLDRFETEMATTPYADRRGLAAWLAEEVGGRWAVEPTLAQPAAQLAAQPAAQPVSPPDPVNIPGHPAGPESGTSDLIYGRWDELGHQPKM